jgi:F-box and WD-40 domain protein 1/11
MLADSNTGRSARRRPSLLLRTRPRTAVPVEYTQTGFTAAGTWEDQTAHDGDHITSCVEGPAIETSDGQNLGGEHSSGQVLEETSVFPDPSPRHRAARSFSTLRHGVDSLRALGRRLSVTVRRRSSRQNLHVAPEEMPPDDYFIPHAIVGGTGGGHSRNAWFKGPSINRRPSLHSVSALQTFYASTGSNTTSIPGIGFDPPVFSDDLSGGAAARAAAAAQNEMAKAERVACRGDSNLFDKTERDAESGIGIDLRDRSELSDEELAVVRIGNYILEDLFLGAMLLISKSRSCQIPSR